MRPNFPLLATSALISLLATPALGMEQVVVPPTDPNIQYLGRWDFTDSMTPNCGWQGSGFRVRFEGTGVRATLDSIWLNESFRVVVDGNVLQSTKFVVTPGPALYTLADGLSDGVHSVELIKETYEGVNVEFHGLESEGTGLLQPSPPARRRIEFYGDSNLAGSSLGHEQDNSAVQFIGNLYGYAAITARMFDAEYQNISWSGSTISGVNARFDRIDWFSATPAWDFASNPADLVVVNVGANNVGQQVSSIKAQYHAFLDALRGAHPSAHIVLFNAYGWDFNEPANYTHEVVAERNDPNMSVAIFPWVFEQFHGCEYDHGGMAAALADHITKTLGWGAAPNDVMSGFGVGGDVANGSFEESAPFGGYGWRYFTDAGVSRIEDGAAAHDGSWFLRLSNGAATHQPNPADPGDLVEATIWLRGESRGEEASLTIDFRNQQLYTAPMATFSQTVILTSQWLPYTIRAVAPFDTPQPVFHTRLTIGSGTNDAVLVDLISQSITSGSAADLNGDGIVNGADLANLLAVWGPCAIDCLAACQADFNDDCFVNGADLAQLLANWSN
jgi:lysophospholipase L1-like esterase